MTYFRATEVVLLLKLGMNEVFFRHKSAEDIYGFCTTYPQGFAFTKPLYFIYFAALK
jgi:hypothetical protein